MTELKIGKAWINGKLVYYPDYIRELKKGYKKRKKKRKEGEKDGRFIHGMGSKKKGPTPTYLTWQKIKSYYRVKKRTTGIETPFHPEWLEPKTGFLNFLRDMGEKPSKKHKLRLLVSANGHVPGNCIWIEGGKVSVICPVCNTEFVALKCKRGIKKYCSYKCKMEIDGFKKRLSP